LVNVAIGTSINVSGVSVFEETVITPFCLVEDKFGEVLSSKDEAESGEIGFVASWTISCVNLARDQVVTGIKKRNS